MFTTVLTREPCHFDQDIVNRILVKVAQGKKIIIVGLNWKSYIFAQRYGINVAYYAVYNYNEKLRKLVYTEMYGVELRSIYDIALEQPGSFYVVGVDLEQNVYIQEKWMMDLGLEYYEDFCILAGRTDENLPWIDDPHLYHTIDFELPGIKVFGNEKNEHAIRILTLGGVNYSIFKLSDKCCSMATALV